MIIEVGKWKTRDGSLADLRARSPGQWSGRVLNSSVGETWWYLTGRYRSEGEHTQIKSESKTMRIDKPAVSQIELGDIANFKPGKITDIDPATDCVQLNNEECWFGIDMIDHIMRVPAPPSVGDIVQWSEGGDPQAKWTVLAVDGDVVWAKNNEGHRGTGNITSFGFKILKRAGER